MSSDGTYAYTYYNDGSEKTRIGAGTTTTYSYDQENRLVSIQETGTTTLTVSYTYDVLGRRVAQTEWVPGSATVVTSLFRDATAFGPVHCKAKQPVP